MRKLARSRLQRTQERWISQGNCVRFRAQIGQPQRLNCLWFQGTTSAGNSVSRQKQPQSWNELITKIRMHYWHFPSSTKKNDIVYDTNFIWLVNPIQHSLWMKSYVHTFGLKSSSSKDYIDTFIWNCNLSSLACTHRFRWKFYEKDFKEIFVYMAIHDGISFVCVMTIFDNCIAHTIACSIWLCVHCW